MATIQEQLSAAPVVDDLNRTENPIGAPWVKMNPGTSAGRTSNTAGSVGYTPATSFVAGEDEAYWSTSSFASGLFTYIYGIFTVSRIGSNERQTGIWLCRDKAKPVETQNGYLMRIERKSGANESKFTIERWVGGVQEVLGEFISTEYIAESQIAFTVGNGKLTIWARKSTLEEWSEKLQVSDSTYAEGYSGLRGKGHGEWCVRDFRTGTISLAGGPEVSTGTKWTMVVTSLAGKAINEVRQATDRKVVMSLNKPSTASFTVRPDNPLLVPLFEDDTLLKVYEGSTLRFHGFVVSTELATNDDGSAPSVKVNAADPAWKLSRRILGRSSGGTKYTGDKAKSSRKMINELNGESNGNTGIKLLAEGEYSAGGSGEYVAGPYKAALSCINDLAHGFDGFDWYMEPIEYSSGAIATYQAKATYGKTAHAVFEHGYGQKNIRKLSYVRDLAGLANIAYHLPDEGFTEGAVVKTAEDATSLAHRGRYEAIADGFGLTDSTLRQNWVNEVVRVRKNPRFVVAMTVDVDDNTGRVPKIGTDYWLGDLVSARSVIAETTMFNGKVRVYQIQVEINEAGAGTVTPILIDEEGTEL